MMKKLLLLLLLCVASSVFAAQDADVTMVSYKQSWLDNEGTLALKNNTNETIKSISFEITYFDMSGNPVDYKDFYMDIEIKPGMTKKLDIEAYEHERNYHYYKTEDKYGHPAFKIDFKLIDYNVKADGYVDSDYNYSSSSSYESTSDYSETPSLTVIIVVLAIVLLIVGFVVGMYVLVAMMAKKRKRNVPIWILLSIFATPLIMAIVLLAIGDAEENGTYKYEE